VATAIRRAIARAANAGVGVRLTPGVITLCVSDLALERPLDTEFVGAAATSTSASPLYASANEIEGGELRCVRSVYFQK
jgi:hypothetical protein